MIETINIFMLVASLISYGAICFLDRAEKQFGLDLVGMSGVENLQDILEAVFEISVVCSILLSLRPWLLISFLFCGRLGTPVRGAVLFCSRIVKGAFVRAMEGLGHAAGQFQWCIREINQIYEGVANFMFERVGGVAADHSQRLLEKDRQLEDALDKKEKKDLENERLKGIIASLEAASIEKEVEMERDSQQVNEHAPVGSLSTMPLEDDISDRENSAPLVVRAKMEAFCKGAVARKIESIIDK